MSRDGRDVRGVAKQKRGKRKQEKENRRGKRKGGKCGEHQGLTELVAPELIWVIGVNKTLVTNWRAAERGPLSHERSRSTEI